MSIGMSDELTSFDQRAVIKVCGVGGGGGNAVGRMIEAGLKDVEFIAVNTDAQALKSSAAAVRLQIGADITAGLGSGAKPEVGQKAATEDRARIGEVLGTADMVFITAGLGGGTGTGAAPIVAEVARNSGALTVAIVTLPFDFEGAERNENAQLGLSELEQYVDTLIVVPNDRVAQLCQSDISFVDAFKQADEVLHNGVRAISELITVPGLINLDFADVRTVMKARGRALMGIGTADGEHRAVRAAQEAIVCPLLEQSNIEGATSVIANVKGGRDITMREVQEAVSTVQAAAHPDANIIFGAVVDDLEREEIQVTVIAAGFDASVVRRQPELSVYTPKPRPDELVFERAAHAVNESSAPPVSSVSRPERRDLQSPEASLRQPDSEFLFSEEELMNSAEPAVQVQGENESARSAEPEEDLGIPAFMRRRKRKK